MTEEWKPVTGTSMWASTLGRIRRDSGVVLSQSVGDSNPYARVTHRGRVYKVHDLVSLAFHGPKPSGLEVRHLDDVKTNNAPENLRYGTRSENRLDAVRNGVDFHASQTHCSAGHEFTEENTYDDGAQRHCRRCNRDSQRRRRKGMKTSPSAR